MTEGKKNTILSKVIYKSDNITTRHIFEVFIGGISHKVDAYNENDALVQFMEADRREVVEKDRERIWREINHLRSLKGVKANQWTAEGSQDSAREYIAALQIFTREIKNIIFSDDELNYEKNEK